MKQYKGRFEINNLLLQESPSVQENIPMLLASSLLDELEKDIGFDSDNPIIIEREQKQESLNVCFTIKICMLSEMECWHIKRILKRLYDYASNDDKQFINQYLK